MKNVTIRWIDDVHVQVWIDGQHWATLTGDHPRCMRSTLRVVDAMARRAGARVVMEGIPA